MHGRLALVAGILLSSTHPLAAQQGSSDAAAALRFGFNEVSAWVTRSIELVPADKYAYRPAQTVRTFGQLVAHLADSYNYFCAQAQGRQVQWSDTIEKGPTDKATVVNRLNQALTVCTGVYTSGGNVAPLMANIAHTNLHYGNMITYMRMLGLVPPSS